MERIKNTIVPTALILNGGVAMHERSITAQIVDLQKRLLATVGLTPEAIAERERIQRRLCDLQGMDFDAPDGLHEFD